MKFSRFLKEKIIFLIFVGCITCFSSFLLYMVQSEIMFILFIPSVFLIGSILSLLPEFLKKRNYYSYLNTTKEQLEKLYLLSEVVACPDFYEGEILFDLLKLTGKAMNDEIAKYKHISEDYQEYVELWVHEIKTPIAGAKLICENIGERTIIEELDKIEVFVEQILYYARSGSVEKDYTAKTFALSDIVKGVLKENARYLISNKISIQSQELNHTVITDSKWLSFILRQIIENSVKYGCNTLRFESVKREKNVSLFIKDDGVGISQKDLKRVFEKSFTGENGRRFKHSTGMGLYLCKKLCDRLGLGISLTSEPLVGTEVEIIFPLESYKELS